MEQSSSSSKVTVEYFDPSGVYQLLSPGLLSRLPLRNLHWESHSGPLRSISSLHIDFIPSSQLLSPLSTTEPYSATTPITPVVLRLKSEESVSTGDDGFRTHNLGQTPIERPDSSSGTHKPIVKERRHQIPGLRQTPYLKVLFLRCDDIDTYKAHTRRQVREWIKEHTPPSQSTTKLNAQENHDAFEWLVVHIVIPNTAAATQPNTSGKSTDGSSGSATEKARWRGGGSPTILDKLRQDFNSTSKSSIDRIAQIRIGVNDVPYEMLPRVVPAIPGSYTETTQENDAAWQDLISKLKMLILSSFDMRVTQYEEDIREKDAQRTLPGWNFCTFFMLKEGLARGFESVGLVEDALVGYDELAVGLDAIVRDQASSGLSAEHGGSFLPYTKELKILVERARTSLLKDLGEVTNVAESDDPIDLQSTADGSDHEADEIPLNATKKRYRDLILSNNISIFDFRCYLFARQLSLLLRLANAWSSQEELLAKLKEQREASLLGVAARLPTSQPGEDVEDLAVLGEICKRSMDFIASISRIMREDISASYKTFQQNIAEETMDSRPRMDTLTLQAFDNIVSSFTFSIAQQILAQTSTKSLPIPPSTLAPPSDRIGLDGQEPKAAIPEPKTMMHPARSSSLAIRSHSREPPRPGVSPGGRRASVPERDRSNTISIGFLKPGLEALSAHRAELYLLSRSVLEKMGREREWSAGWAEATERLYGSNENMDNIDLGSKQVGEGLSDGKRIRMSSFLHGISNKLLKIALDNEDDFFRLYETLTDKALRHYTVANHVQSVQMTMADLAVLKYHLKDYAAATSYLYRMTPFYGEGGWTQIELSMLVVYAKCLKQLQRRDEYVRVVLKLLSKAARAEKERFERKLPPQLGRPSSLTHEEPVPNELYLDELLQITRTSSHEVKVPLENFFSIVEVDGTPIYHSGRDTFALKLRLRYLLSEDMNVEKAKVRITSVQGDSTRDVWLESDGPLLFRCGNVSLVVQSNVTIPGTYIVSHVALFASNMILRYDHGNTGPASGRNDPFLKCPKLLIYHQAEAFDLRLFASRYLHLDRNRSLEIELSSGWNDVINGELHVRAATAGLRLQTSEAGVVSGVVETPKTSEAGKIIFGAMSPATKTKLRIPFNLEHEVHEISLKLEISYTTKNGEFFFATSLTMSIMLPLGVNVQDVFKHKALFSRFTISSATTSPLRLVCSQLDNSEIFQAQCGNGLTRPLVVFPRQPASMLYKITKIPAKAPRLSDHSGKSPRASLSLTLHYICLEEEIDNAITRDLRRAFHGTQLYPFIRLIIPTVLAEVHTRISPYDLERTAILNEISTSMLSTVRWRDHFSGLGRILQSNEDAATLLAERLEEWQKNNLNVALIPISIDEVTISNSRSIVIPVEVPSVTVVHTADLKLLKTSSIPPSTVVVSNQPISASLVLKWTRIWDTESPTEPGITRQSEDLDFVYEVSGPSDNWLIGGRRKGHFKVPKSSQTDQIQKLSFPVVLIPLREGILPYPNVEIKPVSSPRVIGAGGSSADESGIQMNGTVVTCETDYKNSGETVRVISDTRKTTVSLDASGPQGGAMLLETERRTGGQDAIRV